MTVTGCRRARYRGLAKTRLEHVYAAVAINLHRLDAYWNDTPLDRTRTSHLARLDQSLRLAALTDELATNNKDISAYRRREAFRRKQPDILAKYQSAACDTAARALNAIALEQAREIIEDMPPRQKKVALMRWQDHMKASEIAAELGIAESTVHAHLHTARGKLVAGLERYYPFGSDNGEER